MNGSYHSPLTADAYNPIFDVILNYRTAQQHTAELQSTPHLQSTLKHNITTTTTRENSRPTQHFSPLLNTADSQVPHH
jgi:hypothetical protein